MMLPIDISYGFVLLVGSAAFAVLAWMKRRSKAMRIARERGSCEVRAITMLAERSIRETVRK